MILQYRSGSASPNLPSPNVWLVPEAALWPEAELGPLPGWVKAGWETEKDIQLLALASQPVLVVRPAAASDSAGWEKIRKQGAAVVAQAEKLGWKDLVVAGNGVAPEVLLAFAEGAGLASYKFTKYKSKPEAGIETLTLQSPDLPSDALQSLGILLKSVALTRDLVNEPASHLTAARLSEVMVQTGKESGFEVEVLEENKIQALKMGGLLGVNQGSDLPPTFNILEYRPAQPKNAKPVVLVGKGVVYDTGGHSLKTSGGMETMKCDMAGAATVLGIFKAVAELGLPVHLIGLVPATDNRISAAAFSPGDVITISDGTTVEVLNTDAEGRLILADALVFAKKYDPQLVLDFATLTGAAARAIGKEGFVFMGTASEDVKRQLQEAQVKTYERGVEFPLWDEYAEQIKSPVADLKNLGGAEAGAITAGKFLQHFTSYPWLHFDIAGPAFYEGAAVGYIPKGGTGFCVRMVVEFLKGLG